MKAEAGKLVLLAGNPNVGKSTIFNALTGMRQHTGNWPGKTVELAQGTYFYKGEEVCLVDLPGTYALESRSKEEEVAAEFLLEAKDACVIAVCDATCFARSLILTLQILERTERVFVCLNLMDEAEKKGIEIDLAILSHELGVPVVGVSAARGEGLDALQEQTRRILDGFEVPRPHHQAAWGEESSRAPGAQDTAQERSDKEASAFVRRADEIAARAEKRAARGAPAREEKLDRVLTGRVTGALAFVGLLVVIFWLTLRGANYPGVLLQRGFGRLETLLWRAAEKLKAPDWLSGAFLQGAYQTTAKVISVMLPPVMIFFPLFTLLEDGGYLPRVAFLMDGLFERCGSCGKQALTMCMGFGCNAAGVSGCRIIDSRRERLIAMLTNSLVPCNGRFPTLLTICAAFFGSSALTASVMLAACILLGVGATMGVSFALGKTVLRGEPSPFIMQMPPFRRPKIWRVLVRASLDRSLFVLGRAAAVAAPAGVALWALGHVRVGESAILVLLAGFLEPVGKGLGMNGAALLAFVLAWPANELLLPVLLMILGNGGTFAELEGAEIFPALLAAGWTKKMALCMMIFTLFHFPCSTTVWTIRKESGRLSWALAAMLLPTLLGAALCWLLNALL